MINIVYVFLVDIILEAGMIDQSAGENAAVLSDSLQMESGILVPVLGEFGQSENRSQTGYGELPVRFG